MILEIRQIVLDVFNYICCWCTNQPSTFTSKLLMIIDVITECQYFLIFFFDIEKVTKFSVNSSNKQYFRLLRFIQITIPLLTEDYPTIDLVVFKWRLSSQRYSSEKNGNNHVEKLHACKISSWTDSSAPEVSTDNSRLASQRYSFVSEDCLANDTVVY